MRRATWVRWAGLASVVALAAPRVGAVETKVVACLAPARLPGAERLPDLLRESLLASLAAVPGVTVSVARPGPDIAADIAALPAGEVARRLCLATGAQVALLVTPARAAEGALGLLTAVCGYDQRRDLLDPLPPLRAAPSAAEPLPVLARGVAQQAAEWVRRTTGPRAEVVAARPGLGRLEVQVRPDAALPATGGSYDVEALGPVLVCAPTNERFDGPGQIVGRGRLLDGRGDGLWLALPEKVPVQAGDTLRLLAPGAAALGLPGETLVVTSRPWGALATVGGGVQGVTPARVALPAGDAEVGVLHPNALPWSARLNAKDRAAGVVAALLVGPGGSLTPGGPLRSAVRVESDPAGAEVLINGTAHGATPLTVPDLAGPVEVTVRRAGYRPWTTSLVVTGPLSLRAQLEPLDGVVQVVSDPPGAKVFVDGRELGVTPLELQRVPVGEHEVVVLGGGKPFRRVVVVHPDTTVRLNTGPLGQTSPARTVATARLAPPRPPRAEGTRVASLPEPLPAASRAPHVTLPVPTKRIQPPGPAQVVLSHPLAPTVTSTSVLVATAPPLAREAVPSLPTGRRTEPLRAPVVALGAVLAGSGRVATEPVVLPAGLAGTSALAVPVGRRAALVAGAPAAGPGARLVSLPAIPRELPLVGAPSLGTPGPREPFPVVAVPWRQVVANGSTRLNLEVVCLAGGEFAVRCALTPARPSTVAPCLDGFAIDFPGVPARRTAWWDIVDVPGLAGIGVESEPAGVGHTRVHVRLGWRVNARVDSTSRPDSLCFVLVLPESHARAQEPAGHGS